MKSLVLPMGFLLATMSLGAQTMDLNGAWESGPEENRTTMTIAGPYFSAVVMNRRSNTYLGTCGGKWRMEGREFVGTHEFNTLKPDWIGKEHREAAEIKDGILTLSTPDKTELFSRLDNGTPGQLSGAWLITGRMGGGAMQKMTPGARKTMKILSGTRFQWIAYNSETGEFFGTGGGTYSTENGKYTERIDFFSRDNSRVGMSLQFDFALENGAWHHRGLSSKGDPIDELWTRRERLEK